MLSSSVLRKIFTRDLPQVESSSIQGRKPSQEDSFLITGPRHGMRLVFVADGVGGHGHGDFASRAVVDHYAAAFEAMDVDTDVAGFLYQNAVAAARKVLGKCVEDSSYKNCGTTISGFMALAGSYYTINIGDSRVYLWSEDFLSRETHDHSVVQELVDRGEITEDEAFHHPRRNMMTSAIGQDLSMMKVDVNGPYPFKHGDILFAFSDGVHDALTDKQILSMVASYKDTPGLAERITEAAYNAGGKDNITALVYRYFD